jgi:serine protease
MPRPRLIAAVAAVAAALAAPTAAHADRGPIAHIDQVQAPPATPAPTPDPTAPLLPTPDDPGRTTDAGGWQQLQWNFLGAGTFGVDAPSAWLNTFAAGRPGGAGVVVAVLDTGVAYANHGRFKKSPDLVGTHFTKGYDFVDDDPYPDDHNGHGTHVASTIAEATNNGIAVTGLAFGATIMPIRVLDSRGEGDVGEIARGVRWAARRGAQVINLSLEFGTEVRASDIPKLVQAIVYAHRKGAVVVSASGNEGGKSVSYPAKAPDVISVGATTEHGCLSIYSNEGSGLDLVAPGGGADASFGRDANCNRPGPTGRDIYQMTFVHPNHPSTFGIPGGYEGTSMAVPHVSATAALIIASGVLGPKPTPDAIEAQLKATARDLGATGYDRRYGAGLIDAGAATTPVVAPPPPATSSG